MIILLSPSKSQDFTKLSESYNSTQIIFKKKTLEVLEELKRLNKNKLKDILGVSPKLVDLNYDRFKSFNTSLAEKDSKQAIFAYTGDVYSGLNSSELKKTEINFLQKHLRIITGFYGILRPLDLIQAYRLEMKNKLSVKGSNNLYDLWEEDLTKYVASELKSLKSDLIVNLASNEYSKAINFKNLNSNLITPVFKDKAKSGDYKVIAIYAKKARGMMVNYIAKNKVTSENNLKDFNYEGYKFNKAMSKKGELVFLRT